MSTAVIKPKPGTYNGVKYRSQLEIAWAKFFDSHSMKYEYIDTPTHDFLVNGSPIEVKPRNAKLVLSAVARIFGDCDKPGTIASIYCGYPPSAYGNALLINAILCVDSIVALTFLEWRVCEEDTTYMDVLRKHYEFCNTANEILQELRRWIE